MLKIKNIYMEIIIINYHLYHAHILFESCRFFAAKYTVKQLLNNLS